MGDSSSDESESSSPFKKLLKRKLKSGLKPASTKLTLPDGSVQILQQQGLSTCDTIDNKPCPSGASQWFVVDNTPDLTVGCVLNQWLFVSSQDFANDINLIRHHKITHILSLLPEFTLIPEVQASIREHLVLDYFDDIGFSITNLEILTPALEFITKVKSVENGKVLVHCNAGISRAPSIVMLYLMKCEQFSFEDAFKLVKFVRAKSKPNEGFLNKLKHFKH